MSEMIARLVKFALVAAAGLAAVFYGAGYMTPATDEYRQSTQYVRGTLTAIGLPADLFGAELPPYDVDVDDPGRVVWRIWEGGVVTLRIIATLKALDPQKTEVRVEITGFPTETNKILALRIAAIRHFHVTAIREHIAGAMARRPARTLPVALSAAVLMAANIGAMIAGPDRSAEAYRKHSEDNIARAYAQEAEEARARGIALPPRP